LYASKKKRRCKQPGEGGNGEQRPGMKKEKKKVHLPKKSAGTRKGGVRGKKKGSPGGNEKKKKRANFKPHRKGSWTI